MNEGPTLQSLLDVVSATSRRLIQHPLTSQNLAKLRLSSLSCFIRICCDRVTDQQFHWTKLAHTNAEMGRLKSLLALDRLNVSDEIALVDLHDYPHQTGRRCRSAAHFERWVGEGQS